MVDVPWKQAKPNQTDASSCWVYNVLIPEIQPWPDLKVFLG